MKCNAICKENAGNLEDHKKMGFNLKLRTIEVAPNI